MTNSFSNDIRTYALAGAQARLSELNDEQDQIHQLFPELRNGTVHRRITGLVSSSEDAPSTPSPRRSRRPMSAAQRKAVGERMKKYWAGRRGAQAAATVSSDSPTKDAKIARGTAKRGPRTMSPEARKRISDAQKARWAKQRGETKATEASAASETSSAVKGRRTAKRRAQGAAKRRPRKMSAAARKRISQAQKKRWAATRKTA